MKYCDHDDPEIFKECVSAITLKGRPQGLLEEWVIEAEVVITVAPGPWRGPQKARPWLAVDELDELPWTSKSMRPSSNPTISKHHPVCLC